MTSSGAVSGGEGSAYHLVTNRGSVLLKLLPFVCSPRKIHVGDQQSCPVGCRRQTQTCARRARPALARLAGGRGADRRSSWETGVSGLGLAWIYQNLTRTL